MKPLKYYETDFPKNRTGFPYYKKLTLISILNKIRIMKLGAKYYEKR